MSTTAISRGNGPRTLTTSLRMSWRAREPGSWRSGPRCEPPTGSGCRSRICYRQDRTGCRCCLKEKIYDVMLLDDEVSEARDHRASLESTLIS